MWKVVVVAAFLLVLVPVVVALVVVFDPIAAVYTFYICNVVAAVAVVA